MNNIKKNFIKSIFGIITILFMFGLFLFATYNFDQNNIEPEIKKIDCSKFIDKDFKALCFEKIGS